MVGELRRLRDSGIDIGVPLTAKTEVMEEQLKKLLGTKKPLSPNKRVTREVGSHLSEQNWHALLPHLNLRTMYRCLLLYRECNRAVGRNLIWPQLVARDLGLVPSFIRNMKLYYLRGMNFGVPLSLYTWERTNDLTKKPLPPNEQFREVDTNVMLAVQYTPYYSKGNVIKPNIILPYNVTIRKIFWTWTSWDSASKYLSTDGRFYEEDGTLARPPIELPPGEVVTDMKIFISVLTFLLTKSGKVFVVVRARGTPTMSVPVPEPIIDISSYNGRFVSISGRLYEPGVSVGNKGQWVASATLSTQLEYGTRWSIESYEYRPLGVAGRDPITVATDGYVSYRGSITGPLPKPLQNEFDKYQLVSVYVYDSLYWFRGFKRAMISDGR